MYAKGSLSRGIMDVLRDAPDQTLRARAIFKALSNRCRKAPKRNAVGQALHRMLGRADIERTEPGVYRLLKDPIPDSAYSERSFVPPRP